MSWRNVRTGFYYSPQSEKSGLRSARDCVLPLQNSMETKVSGINIEHLNRLNEVNL